MVFGFLKSIFGSKTKRRISDRIARLSHPTLDDFNRQVGSFAHLKEGIERELAIARKKAEIAMPNIKRAFVNKQRIIKLNLKFKPYTNTRKALASVSSLAIRQQFFLEDLGSPLKRAYFGLIDAKRIFLLKDDPEINALAEKIDEVDNLAKAYDNQLVEQCSEVEVCIRRNANLDIRKKPELWEEKDKIGRLDKVLGEIVGEGFEQLDQKVKYLVSAQNLMEKFSARVQGITARIEQIVDSIIKGEYVYYSDIPVGKDVFFIVILENPYSVTVNLEKRDELVVLAQRLEAESIQLMDLMDSFNRANTRSRFPEGVPGAKEINDDITALTDKIRRAKSSIDTIIKQKQYRSVA